MRDRKAEHILWEEASSPQDREAVFRFRFDEYFADHEGLPGVDSVRHRVALPHDRDSRHLMARSPDGEILAVGTITPASAASIAPEWKDIFQFQRLAPILEELVLISRVVVLAESRGSTLFGQMSLRLAYAAVESGFRYAAHYCAPRMISLYERIGYRCYGSGGILGASFRVPMILSIDAEEALRRARSPVVELLHGRAADENRVLALLRLYPELADTPLCLLGPDNFQRRLLELCPQLKVSNTELLRLLRRAGVFRAPKGSLIAQTGQDEGDFLLLSGFLDDGGRLVSPGSVCTSGSSQLTAIADSILASIPSNPRGVYVESSYQ